MHGREGRVDASRSPPSALCRPDVLEREMTRIFISYRRDDSSGWVGHLAVDLQARFGRDAVFVDVDTISAASDFAVTIAAAIAGSSVVLAVIGPRWLDRLDDPNDFVRFELKAALERNLPIVHNSDPRTNGRTYSLELAR